MIVSDAREVYIGATYRHYKRGTRYLVIGITRDSETLDKRVEYIDQDAISDPDEIPWSRPMSGGGCGFLDDVTRDDGTVVQRFVLVALP